jgi:hypothetical protein
VDDVEHAQSITRFLTLPTVIQISNPRSKDLAVDFTKFVILTSDQYVAAATQLQQAREEALRKKKREKLRKKESRKRKASEREVAAAARAEAWKEVREKLVREREAGSGERGFHLQIF